MGGTEHGRRCRCVDCTLEREARHLWEEPSISPASEPGGAAGVVPLRRVRRRQGQPPPFSGAAATRPRSRTKKDRGLCLSGELQPSSGAALDEDLLPFSLSGDSASELELSSCASDSDDGYFECEGDNSLSDSDDGGRPAGAAAASCTPQRSSTRGPTRLGRRPRPPGSPLPANGEFVGGVLHRKFARFAASKHSTSAASLGRGAGQTSLGSRARG